MNVPCAEILLRIGLTTIIGVVFGLERKCRQKSVGSRTHVLIAVAACGIAIMSVHCFAYGEPARLVVGVLTGIGFIGTGVIWKSPNGDVQGITTAAELFLIACIGIGFGLGAYFLSAILSCVGLITLIARWLKQQIIRVIR